MQHLRLEDFFIPKSHLQHDELCARIPAAKIGMDFVEIPENDPVLKDGGILVGAKAGDLLLWDSRTVHCNSPALTIDEHFQKHPYNPEETQKSGPWDIIRLVAYICMLPFSHATSGVIEQRKSAFIHHIPTFHWPTTPIEFHTKSNNPVDITKCSKEQLNLVGYR